MGAPPSGVVVGGGDSEHVARGADHAEPVLLKGSRHDLVRVRIRVWVRVRVRVRG